MASKKKNKTGKNKTGNNRIGKDKTEQTEYQKEVDRLNKIFADRRKEIETALGKAKELEKEEIPTKQDLKKQDCEFKKEEGILKKLMKPQWFLEKQKAIIKRIKGKKSKKKTPVKKKTVKKAKKIVKKKIVKKKTIKKNTAKKVTKKKTTAKKRTVKKNTTKKKTGRKK